MRIVIDVDSPQLSNIVRCFASIDPIAKSHFSLSALYLLMSRRPIGGHWLYSVWGTFDPTGIFCRP